jgi:hypothetical protein
MTWAKFIIGTIICISLITIIKLVFILALNMNSPYVVYVMLILIAIVSTATIRRLGVINYMEALLIILIWLTLELFVDFFIIASFAGLEIYKHLYLWISYFVIAAMVFLLHKKRHVEVRKQMGG